MKIIGYSERGAMNALFYGMAFNEDGEKNMREFLALANIKNIGPLENFYDFEIYNEFSLSEFGSPDLVIIAQNKNKNEKVAFFIEAKASCCKYYDINEQKTLHDDYVSKGKHDNGHASNLFFQLRLKNYFFELKDWFCERMDKPRPSVSIGSDRIKNTKGHERGIGLNPVVQNFVNKFKDCKEAHYIAIIPEQSKASISNPDISYELKIHFVTWEELYGKFKNYKIFKETIDFNQGIDLKIKSKKRIQSQILNTPIIEEKS
ncbi:MAG: hypothetical protein K6G92_07580 [Bacteroidaceae bacterium]|nr:hypothetical protein [Bacteroidaceae bacterium]